MKDFTLTVHRQKIELLTWLICFSITNVLNIIAIIVYETPFTELFTSFFYVCIFSTVLYIVWSTLRLIVYGIQRIYLKKH